MLKKRFFLPLKLGILFGLIYGIYNSFGLIDYHYYFRFHLYNTMTKVVIGEINRQIITMSLVFYAIWLLIKLGRKFKEKPMIVDRIVSFCNAILTAKKLNPFIRTAYHSIIIGTLIVGVFLKLGILAWFKQFDSLFFQTAYSQSKWQILAAGVLLLIGVVYLFSLRIAARKPKKMKLQTAAFMDCIKVCCRIIPVVERQNKLYLVMAIFALVINIAAAFLWTETAKSVSKKPNIIIIMADTLRVDHVGCYGYPLNTTPNIDRFAKDGTKFSYAIANSSWTGASVSSFMTSQYPQTVINTSIEKEERIKNNHGIPTKTSNVITIGQSLQNQGYSTGAVISNPLYGTFWNGTNGFDYFNDCSGLKESTSSKVLSITRNWLDTQKNKRFFLFALFVDPHSPYKRHSGYDFDPQYKGKYKDEINVTHTDTSKTVKCDLKHLKSLYNSNIAYTDYYIGQLINDLKKRGLYDDSIIIFLGDHGEQFLDHGGFFHGNTLYNELVRVPFIIKLPHQAKAEVFNAKFPLVNMFPTILSLIGSNPTVIHPQGEAININKDEKNDNYIFASTSLYNKLRSVQNQKYKYIYDLETRSQQLYDLINDPVEQHNIASNEPHVVALLKKTLLDKENEVSVSQKGFHTIDVNKSTNEDIQKLRSNGYLQ